MAAVIFQVPATPAKPLTVEQTTNISLDDASLTHGHPKAELATWATELQDAPAAQPAMAFVPGSPSPALAGTAPLPAWVIPAAQTLLAVPAVAISCWAQLMIMTATVPAGAGRPPAIYPLIAQFTGWCAIGVAVATACDRSRYSDPGGAVAAPLALAAITLAWSPRA